MLGLENINLMDRSGLPHHLRDELPFKKEGIMTQLNFFKEVEEVEEKPTIKRDDLIQQLANRMTNNMDVSDLEEYFYNNQVDWLESLSDEDLKNEYVEEYEGEAPIIEN